MKNNQFKRAKEIKERLAIIDYIFSFYKLDEYPRYRGIGVAARDEHMKKPCTVVSLALPELYEDKLYDILQEYKDELEKEFEEL